MLSSHDETAGTTPGTDDTAGITPGTEPGTAPGTHNTTGTEPRAERDPGGADPGSGGTTPDPAVDGSAPGSPSRVKVSVVVPVYNPGSAIDELIGSLLRQSMPPGEWEAVFVDDGSTDGSGARLDELAARYPDRFRVEHIPNSGWPSRPRNVGIGLARGEYVQFADHDDWFGDEALQRLYAYARENGADVVVGKMAGRGRSVPRELFRRNRPDATLAKDPLIDSLTPHKMFRREFLRREGLLFPEGRRRLEDHVFVTAAYFAAGRISVLSDYVCYIHVALADSSNAGFRRFDPAGYFGNLREALDIVDAHTGPGAFRDRLHRRWLRVEMLGRLTAPRHLAAPEEWRGAFFREVRAVLLERFAPGVAAGLPAPQRALVALVAADRFDDVRRLALWESGVRARATARVTGPAEITVEGELTAPGGAPLTFRTVDGKDVLTPPVSGLPAQALDVTDRLGSARIDLVARRRGGGGEEFFVPGETTALRVPTPDGGFRVRHRTVATLAPDTLNSGRNAGRWELKARVSSCGWQQDTELPVSLTIASDGAPPQLRKGTATPFLVRVKRRARRLTGGGARG
ncbi:glycosyltransferase family A protein [Streptomyces fuscigenes]|uniref:glycosyltransferase family A protein n=1 Tax=Streptomyces fuscigenes TaxID=1528880 RepID=UPI001F2322B3|nr:glycosyltransferase family A protein [Streptomyces fuscigenes]MCF3960537.1 glycosyltransferase [Streptomyces fuscigenes]